MILDIDGTVTSPTLESLIGKSLACKNIFINTLVVEVTSSIPLVVFLYDVSVTLFDKTDGSDPKKWEYYWMKALKTMVPYGLNIEDSV